MECKNCEFMKMLNEYDRKIISKCLDDYQHLLTINIKNRDLIYSNYVQHRIKQIDKIKNLINRGEKMQDLTEYSDSELSMIIMNDESLNNMRFTLSKDLLHDLGLRFTNEQWNEFQDDLENEED